MKIALLLFTCVALAQPWSGIIDSTRATDWSGAGIPGGIPARATQCGSTIAAYTGSASTINTAITNCTSGQHVQLGSGTFNLSSGIQFNGKSNVTLRGNGADTTLLVFTGAGAGWYNSVVSLEPSGLNEVNGSENNVCNWTAGYSPGTTVVTLANCGSTTPAVGSISNLAVGSILVLDQLDESADTGTIWNCLSSTAEGGAQCSNNGTGAGGFQRGDGTTNVCASCTGGVMKWRSQQQAVVVTAINGADITISPGLYMPNWSSGQKPQAWFATTRVSSIGIENFSISAGTPSGIGGTNTSGAGRNIHIGNCDQCWVKGVRSLFANRSHVELLIATRFEIRDSYFYQNINHGSVSYGVESNTGFNGKVENNIFQQSTDGEPNCNGSCAGNVFAYNFNINNVYGTTGWMQAGFYAHASGDYFNLWEGNVGPGYTSDDVHGTHHFETLFRNRIEGNQDAGCGSSGTATCTAQTNAIHAYVGSRYYNVIGNVLGRSGYHTKYTCAATLGSGNSCTDEVTSVFRLGFSGGGGTNNNGFCLQPACSSNNRWDPQVAVYMLRWGNWDTVTNATRWCGNSGNTGWATTCSSTSEVPTSIAVYSNAVPSTETLPSSLYLSSRPSWFRSVAYPPIGPDVTGGNISNTGGHANVIPAQDCYLNVMSGAANGTGSALAFNAATCYDAATTTSRGASGNAKFSGTVNLK